ncbi:MAG: hypothetical protein RB191_02130 [Terriglobia bacterium]|nr:hypothetical protein [Terriglobia bacterium]
MYKTEMPVIRDAMRHDLTIFRRGFMFAICSIRQPTINVPDQLAILFDGVQDENPLFGHKFDAWAWISDDGNAARLWRNLLALENYADKLACEHAIACLLEVPGLGIVKAAFICQLMGFDVACLDARNIKREGRNPRAYETRGSKSGRKWSAKTVARYVAETHGRAQEYWDAWCYDVAEAYGRTAQQISDLHLAIIPAGFIPF